MAYTCRMTSALHLTERHDLPLRERAILDAVAQAQEPLTRDELTEALGYKPRSLRIPLASLIARGELVEYGAKRDDGYVFILAIPEE